MKTANVLRKYGVTAAEARKRGMSYWTVWFHLRGERNVSPKQALRYHEAFSIPLWELCPELWEPPASGKKGE